MTTLTEWPTTQHVRHYLDLAELLNLWLFLNQFRPYMFNAWEKKYSFHSTENRMDIKNLEFFGVMWGKNVFSKLQSGVHATYPNTVT